MTERKITESVFYTGVDDHKSTLFEALWPLPYGVSYNSYIVKGEATALIDTVENEYLDEYSSWLEKHGVESPAYLIVNHMEPDHSGCIPYLCERFPEMKIVGNRLTAGMLKGYYEIPDERMHIIKDGDTLDLGGGKVLKFVTIPMVHWPETMVTILESEGVIFSGDAFGTFGALDGKVLDEEIGNLALYFDEAYRYYACIVAKYAERVQNALNKLSGLELKYICSTHGPVWHKCINEIVSLYDKLSRNETEPGVVIAYGSMYGHTGEMAKVLADFLRERGLSVALHDACRTDLSVILSDVWRYRGLIIGSATYNGAVLPPVQSLLSALELRGVKNHIAACFGCFTWASAACRLISESLERMGLERPCEPVDMKMSMNPQIHTQLQDLAQALADTLIP